MLDWSEAKPRQRYIRRDILVKKRFPLLFLFSVFALWCSIGMTQPHGRIPDAPVPRDGQPSRLYLSALDEEERPNTLEEEIKTMQNAKKTTVRLKTNLGEMAILLHEREAPETVANFLRYVQEGFYDGTIFHRVIPKFMIQGGGFKPGMVEKETAAAIRNEADNGLANEKGTIAMARTSDPHSATSQFFINASDNDFLDYKSPTSAGWGYCVFGKLVEGEAVLDAINQVSTGSFRGYDDVPVDDVILEKVTLDQ
uniref:Peptidyl-prolyl cis-trans isomerase n=1 Tax=Candidatus Kentrum sp. FM TaxID=2126340 RepID=A0A450S967_9GAMM|nr:MAG: Peptidyl-prolyl cis-trans isomerase (rotamase) -cyclophilin family [Candidatus Kentron sp. FM]